MPELPEVETLRRTLEPHLVGRRIEAVRVRECRLRLPVDTTALRRMVKGRRVLGLRRRAKYLLVDLERDTVLMVHLGMSGRLAVLSAAVPLATHDHVIMGIGGELQLRFNDPRRFGLVTAFQRAAEASHPLLAHLGVEPLGPELSAARLHAESRGSRRPIKSFLMDATRVVGVGNIYACEALFAAGIRPTRAAGALSAARWERLAAAVRTTLEKAITAGGTTLRDFADADGQAGLFAVELEVYGRAGEPCAACGRAVRRIVQAGRSTYYCPGCQSH